MSTIIFNKQIIPADSACISHSDRGFTLGHGLFETILIKNNESPALSYHWKRLEASAPILDIKLPFSEEELKIMLKALILENKLQDKLAGARLTISHGESARGILPFQSPNPNFLITVFETLKPKDKPYSALIVTTRKNEQTPASRVKSISCIDNILARKEAVNQGYDEAILLNTASKIADGATSNIFMVKDGQIFTPPLCDGALPGVVRAMLLDEVKSIKEQSISMAQLMLADEIFLSNALMGIQCVSRLNNKQFSFFPVAMALRHQLREKKNYI